MKKIKKILSEYFSDIWQDKVKRITFIMYITLPFLINIVVEAFNKRSFIKGLTMIFTSFDVFMINLIIIAAIMSFTLILRKRWPAIIFITVVWIAFGVTNFIVKSNRETPLSFSDLQDFGAVFGIFDKYMSDAQIILVICLIVAFLIFIGYMWSKSPRYVEKLNYVRNIIIIGVMWAIMLFSVEIGLATGSISYKFPNMSIAYQEYGFTYCFSVSFVVRGVEKPAEYSDSDIKAIVEKLNKTETVDEDNVKTPNIIFLQLESFIDMTNFEGLELNEPATPNFTRLKSEYPSGYLSVNNVGYGTANTEFEVMTGMNLEDFGPGEFPYKTILQNKTCESLSYILREYGYTSHAMHNNTGTFYSRNEVFKKLGFDTYTSVEYMCPKEYTPMGWVKDAILTDEIIKVLDSTDDPDYIYAISVQGHGSYPSDDILEDPEITITGGLDDEERINQITYYLNQINEMDQFIDDLIKKLTDYDEEVILVMYGDHLPGLGLSEEELVNGSLYQTEYIVWSNFGFNMESEDLETFQLASRILNNLNIDGGVINKFHQVYRNDNKKDYLSALKKLEFDMLYADNYVFDGVNPYEATDLQMGTYPVTITNVVREDLENPIERPREEETEDSSIIDKITSDEDEKVSENEEILPGWLVVSGENFTSYSHVFLNGRKLETIFIDEKTLLAFAPEIKSLDVLVVKQMWKSKTVLSETDEFMYVEVSKETDEEDKDDSEKETTTAKDKN